MSLVKVELVLEMIAGQRNETPRPDPGSLTLNGTFGSIVGNVNTQEFADILFLQPGDNIASDGTPLFRTEVV